MEYAIVGFVGVCAGFWFGYGVLNMVHASKIADMMAQCKKCFEKKHEEGIGV